MIMNGMDESMSTRNIARENPIPFNDRMSRDTVNKTTSSAGQPPGIAALLSPFCQVVEHPFHTPKI